MKMKDDNEITRKGRGSPYLLSNAKYVLLSALAVGIFGSGMDYVTSLGCRTPGGSNCRFKLNGDPPALVQRSHNLHLTDYAIDHELSRYFITLSNADNLGDEFESLGLEGSTMDVDSLDEGVQKYTHQLLKRKEKITSELNKLGEDTEYQEQLRNYRWIQPFKGVWKEGAAAVGLLLLSAGCIDYSIWRKRKKEDKKI
jgi:hypothetical protein